MCVILCEHGRVEATNDLYRLERPLEVPQRLRWILPVKRGCREQQGEGRGDTCGMTVGLRRFSFSDVAHC